MWSMQAALSVTPLLVKSPEIEIVLDDAVSVPLFVIPPVETVAPTHDMEPVFISRVPEHVSVAVPIPTVPEQFEVIFRIVPLASSPVVIVVPEYTRSYDPPKGADPTSVDPDALFKVEPGPMVNPERLEKPPAVSVKVEIMFSVLFRLTNGLAPGRLNVRELSVLPVGENASVPTKAVPGRLKLDEAFDISRPPVRLLLNLP